MAQYISYKYYKLTKWLVADDPLPRHTSTTNSPGFNALLARPSLAVFNPTKRSNNSQLMPAGQKVLLQTTQLDSVLNQTEVATTAPNTLYKACADCSDRIPPDQAVNFQDVHDREAMLIVCSNCRRKRLGIETPRLPHASDYPHPTAGLTQVCLSISSAALFILNIDSTRQYLYHHHIQIMSSYQALLAQAVPYKKSVFLLVFLEYSHYRLEIVSSHLWT